MVFANAARQAKQVYEQVFDASVQECARQLGHLAANLATMAAAVGMGRVERQARACATRAAEHLTLPAVSKLDADLISSAENFAQALEQESSRLTEVLASHRAHLERLRALSEQTPSVARPFADTVERYMREAGLRLDAHLDALSKSRYEPNALEDILVNRLLDRTGLEQLFTRLVTEQRGQVTAQWQAALGHHVVQAAHRPPHLPMPTVEAVITAFLAPIHLKRERPNVMRSVLRTLAGDPFRNEIEAEVGNGLIAARNELMNLLAADVRAWHAAHAEAAMNTVAADLKAREGAAPEQRLQQVQDQLAALAAWHQALGQVTLTGSLHAWMAALVTPTS